MDKNERISILRVHLKKRGYTHCEYCNRKLTNVVSMFRKAGPVCYKKKRRPHYKVEKIPFAKK